ncbi:hypothetical protein X777_04345, partial [Ooceraea biroi]
VHFYEDCHGPRVNSRTENDQLTRWTRRSVTSLKQPHFHEDYHRPRANDRSSPRKKEAAARGDRATVFSASTFSPAIAREPSRRRQRRGESVVRVRQGAAARTLKPTHATVTTINSPHRRRRHYHRQRCRTLSPNAVATTTISPSPPLRGKGKRERGSGDVPFGNARLRRNKRNVLHLGANEKVARRTKSPRSFISREKPGVEWCE